MTKSVYLVCGLLAALLVSPNDGAAKTAETPEANAEVTDNASVQTPSHAPEEALTRLSALAPPPQLSERALGLHTASCLPGTAPACLEFDGALYSFVVFTVP